MKRLLPISVVMLVVLSGCGGKHHPSHHPSGYATLPPKPGTIYAQPSHLKASPTVEQFDSIEYNVPSYAQAVAGYVGGSWPTWFHFTQLFPNLNRQHRVVSIAINAYERAQCLDVEPGDAVPSQAPGWVRSMIAYGIPRPCVYSAISEMSTVDDYLNGAGLGNRVRRWCAWLRSPERAGLVSGCDAVQWTFTALGRNLDESTVSTSFYGPSPAPKLVCFGHGAKVHDPTCVRVRRQAHAAGQARAASQRVYDRRGCPAKRHAKTLHAYHQANCGTFHNRVVFFHGRVQAIVHAYV